MHSFLYFRRAGGSHISALFYACNMQKRENKAIFLRISGEMAKKNKGICSRQQNATGVCRVSCPASTPARLAVSPAGNTVTPNIPRQPASSPPRQPAIIFRHLASFLQSKSQLSLIQHHSFRLVRPTLPAAHLFISASSQLSFIQHTATAGRFHLPAANSLTSSLLFF